VKRSLFVLAAILLAQGGSFLPSAADLPAGWTPAGAESYEGEGLYGYINGGSEVFLQYGFRRAEVGRYEKDAAGTTREITLDIYQMGSPREAFGIFSLRREGGEPSADLGGFPNWASPEQASLAAGPFFVNVIGHKATAEDIGAFLKLAGKRLAGAGARAFFLDEEKGPWSGLPSEGLRPETVRYIQGPLAAQGESEVLAADFWGFDSGTEAASARYGADGLKLVIVEFKTVPPGLLDRVGSVFGEHLSDVRAANGALSARDRAGRVFLFGLRGRRAGLVFGKTDEAAAGSLLRAALTPK